MKKSNFLKAYERLVSLGLLSKQLEKDIEVLRVKLNSQIECKEIITGDKELLQTSIKLDKLIYEYIYICRKEQINRV